MTIARQLRRILAAVSNIITGDTCVVSSDVLDLGTRFPDLGGGIWKFVIDGVTGVTGQILAADDKITPSTIPSLVRALCYQYDHGYADFDLTAELETESKVFPQTGAALQTVSFRGNGLVTNVGYLIGISAQYRDGEAYPALHKDFALIDDDTGNITPMVVDVPLTVAITVSAQGTTVSGTVSVDGGTVSNLADAGVGGHTEKTYVGFRLFNNGAATVNYRANMLNIRVETTP